MSTKLTPVKLFDLYESFTDAFSKKNIPVPFKQYSLNSKKEFSLPKQKFPHIPDSYFLDPPDINWNRPGGLTIDHPLMKCPVQEFDNWDNLYTENDEITPEKLSCAVSKNNAFIFIRRQFDHNWDFIEVLNSLTLASIGQKIPIPRSWSTSSVTFGFGFVNMCADQQDFMAFPPGLDVPTGSGIPTNRYINILLHREIQSGLMPLIQYFIMKLGVSSNGSRVIALPMYMWGFEQILVSAGERLLQLHDIECMPNQEIYLAGVVLLPSNQYVVRVSRIKQGVVENYVDIRSQPYNFSKPTKYEVRISIDHAKYHKTGKISIVVLAENEIYVLTQKPDGVMSESSHFTLPVEKEKSDEWADIIANCGHLILQRNGTQNSNNPAAKAQDIVLYDYQSGIYKDALFSGSFRPLPLLHGIALTHATNLLDNPPMHGYFTGALPGNPRINGDSQKTLFYYDLKR